MVITRPRREEKCPWYFSESGVNPQKNFQWTKKMRQSLRQMREMDGMAISDVINFFQMSLTRLGLVSPRQARKHVTYNTVNNQIRLARREHEGCCYRCGTPLKEEDKTKSLSRRKSGLIMCRRCLRAESRYKKALRKEALAAGLCGTCRKRWLLSGHTQCKKCLSAVYRRRVLAGLCGSCGKNPIDKKRSGRLCKTCLKLNRERGQGSRQKIRTEISRALKR